MRISKDYEVRKNELLDTAKMLFFTVGYESTSINMILEKVGVAKGTFYYYFKSKEDLLEGIFERDIDSYIKQIEPIVDDPHLSPMEKLNLFFRLSGEKKLQNRAFLKDLLRIMYSPQNAALTYEFNRRQITAAVKPFGRVIQQGVDEGVFHTSDPEMTMEMILIIGAQMGDKVADIMLNEPDDTKAQEELIHFLEAYEDAMIRILGAEKGELSIMSRDLVTKLFEKEPKTDNTE